MHSVIIISLVSIHPDRDSHIDLHTKTVFWDMTMFTANIKMKTRWNNKNMLFRIADHNWVTHRQLCSYRGCRDCSCSWALVIEGAQSPLCYIRLQHYKWHMIVGGPSYWFCIGDQELAVLFYSTPPKTESDSKALTVTISFSKIKFFPVDVLHLEVTR